MGKPASSGRLETDHSTQRPSLSRLAFRGPFFERDAGSPAAHIREETHQADDGLELALL